MSVGRMRTQKAKKREARQMRIAHYERQLAMLQGQIGFLGISYQSFTSMPIWARIWWFITSRFDASRALRQLQAAVQAQQAATPAAA